MGNTFGPARLGALCLALSLCAVGCDDVPRAGPPGPVLGRDGGAHGSVDGAAPETDADVDAASDDAATGEGDGGGTGGDGCRETAERFREPFRPDGRGFALAVDGLDVHLVYAEATCAGVGGTANGHRLRYLKFDSAGALGTPETISIVPDDACAKIRDVTLTLAPLGEALVPQAHFLSTRDGMWALYGLRPDEAEPAVAPVAANQSAFVKSMLTATSTAGGTPLLAYAEARADEQALVLQGEGDDAIDVPRLSGLSAIALGEITSERGPLAPVLAYGTDAGITLSLVNERAELVGETSAHAASLGAAPTLAFEASPDGGVLVYTESEQLRFLALDKQGKPLGKERRLTFGNERIVGPSVTSFVTGYAIAFRALLQDNPERARLRIAFTDSVGNLAGFRDLLETSAAGGPLVLKATVDGRLIVGFAEVDDSGAYTLNVARVTCTGGG